MNDMLAWIIAYTLGCAVMLLAEANYKLLLTDKNWSEDKKGALRLVCLVLLGLSVCCARYL